MKKFISILLALTLVLSLGVVAFADGTEPETPPAVTPAGVSPTLSFTKTYVDAQGNTSAVFPTETLAFTVAAAAGFTNPSAPAELPSITATTINSNGQSITVNFPTYTNVGKWKYTVTETAGSTPGVVYRSTGFDITVDVQWNEAGTALVPTAVITTKDDGTNKIDGIKNQYKLGSLSVDKVVTGNMGDKTAEFDIDVTFTSNNKVLSDITYNGNNTIAVAEWTQKDGAWTVTKTITLTDATTAISFSNIPDGVEYTVLEQEKHIGTDATGNDGDAGYTVSYNDACDSTIVADQTKEAVVTNTKSSGVDTGISMDSIPYVLLIAVSVIGLAVFFSRKRVIE